MMYAQPQYRSVAHTATMLGLPRAWLAAEARAGRVPCLRIGRRIVLDPEQVRAALAVRAAEQAVQA